MANLREAQKQMTRRLLLESGLRLFKTKGYAATTVDDIATAAGTTRVTFYAYFPSRSELMKALIDEQLESRLQQQTARHPLLCLTKVRHAGDPNAVRARRTHTPAPSFT